MRFPSICSRFSSPDFCQVMKFQISIIYYLARHDSRGVEKRISFHYWIEANEKHIQGYLPESRRHRLQPSICRFVAISILPSFDATGSRIFKWYQILLFETFTFIFTFCYVELGPFWELQVKEHWNFARKASNPFIDFKGVTYMAKSLPNFTPVPQYCAIHVS